MMDALAAAMKKQASVITQGWHFIPACDFAIRPTLLLLNTKTYPLESVNYSSAIRTINYHFINR